jgi:hypothetical protein
VTWDPAIPATDADLLSAPVRGNFQALDTALMAPVLAAAPQALLKVDASDVLVGIAPGTNGHVLTMNAGVPAWSALPVDPGFANPLTTAGDLMVGGVSGAPTRLAAVATGSVLASAGASTAPTWNASPTVTGLTLSGLSPDAVVFAGPSGALSGDYPNFRWDSVAKALRVGTLSVYAQMQDGVVRSMDTTLNGLAALYGGAGPGLALVRVQANGGHMVDFASSGTGGPYGAGGCAIFDQSVGQLISWDSGGHTSLRAWDGAGYQLRAVWFGAADSGGAGFRAMRVPN